MNRWVIAAACSLINFLIMGMARLAPLLFVASMERFNVGRARASIPYVLCYIFRTMLGPIIGVMGKKFGLKGTTMFGGLACFIGIGACFFAEDIVAITILWGCVYGMGFGFGTSLLPAVLDRTFDSRNKTKANGIALAGACLGGMILPPILEASIKEYGFSGSFLIAAALMLQVAPASMLLTNTCRKNPSNMNTVKGSAEEQDIGGEPFGNETANYLYNKNTEKCSVEEIDNWRGLSIGQIESAQNVQNTNEERSKNSHANLAFVEQAGNVSLKVGRDPSDQTNVGNCSSLTPQVGHDQKENSTAVQPFSAGNVNLGFNTSGENSAVGRTNNTPKLLHFSVVSGNAADSPAQAIGNNVEKPSVNAFWVLVDPTFLVLTTTQSTYAFVLIVIWTIIIDLARDKGVERHFEIYLMMLLPLTDLVGRLGLGWVTDGGHLTHTQFCVISFMLMGLASILLVWVFHLALIVLAIAFFGFTSGGLMSVFPAVVCKSVVGEFKIMALTSRLILLAPMTLAVSPLIGYFREGRGSYDGICYLSGFVLFVCSALSAIIPKLSRRSRDKYEKQKDLK